MPDNISILAQQYTTVEVEQHVELARWSAGNALLIGAVLTIVGLYAVGWMYRHEGRGQMGRGLRWSLTGCRVLVLILLGLIGLEPVHCIP